MLTKFIGQKKKCVLRVTPQAVLARGQLGAVLEKAFHGAVVSGSCRHHASVRLRVIFPMVLGMVCSSSFVTHSLPVLELTLTMKELLVMLSMFSTPIRLK